MTWEGGQAGFASEVTVNLGLKDEKELTLWSPWGHARSPVLNLLWVCLGGNCDIRGYR